MGFEVVEGDARVIIDGEKEPEPEHVIRSTVLIIKKFKLFYYLAS